MKKNICNIYIFLWCLYNLQGTLYARGTIISQLLLILLLFISFFYYFRLLIYHHLPLVLKILSCLFFIWTIYGFVIIVYGNGVQRVLNYSYLKNIYIALLPIFVFYCFVKEGLLSESLLKKWSIVFLILGIIRFNTYSDESLARAIERGSNQEEFTNSKAYVIVAVMPLLPLFYKKPVFQYVLLGICLLYTFLGVKRGAILSGVVCSVWFIYESFKEKRNNGANIWRLLLTTIFIVGIVYAIQQMVLSSDYFIKRFDATMDGNSSGRDKLFITYGTFFINQTNVFHILFGNGADATMRLLNEFAHNDWLELAIDNGLVVVVL